MNSIIPIRENLFFIERGWLNGNHFVFDGGRKVLIDTGYKCDLFATINLIEKTGFEISDTEIILCTHSHCDHIGGNYTIQAKTGCRIMMHPIEKFFMEHKNGWFTWWKYYDQDADFYNVTDTLEDGALLRFDDLELEVIYTPGHASGGIALYAPQERFLISGDALWDGDLGVLTPRIEGSSCLFQALQTLDRLSALRVERVFPGHGPPFRHFEKAVEQAKERLKGFIKAPSLIGLDQIKKIIVFVLMMKRDFSKDDFFHYLMQSAWYAETVDLFFDRKYQEIYEMVMEDFLHKEIVVIQDDRYRTTINA